VLIFDFSCRRRWFFDSMLIILPPFCLTQLTYWFRQPVYFIWLNAEPILLFLHQQPDVAHLAAVYLKYASIGLPAYAFNTISRCALYPIKENQLTVFKSIFPVAGPLYSSDTDNPRGCAHQCSS
jgi:hypothetical protein